MAAVAALRIMNIQQTDLPGVIIVEPRVFADGRGFFLETYEKRRYHDVGIQAEFVQDNLSRSSQGTLRGLHYQIEHAQGKLVQVLLGEIFDVAVDLRRSSSHFGKWTGVRLSEDNHKQIYVPPGFAHGFCVLSETADVAYKCTDFYHPEHERTLLWSDAELGIDWPLPAPPVLSEKDQRGQLLKDADNYA